jgi:hypothetical protein
MVRNCKRGVLWFVVLACGFVIVEDVEAQLLRRRRNWRWRNTTPVARTYATPSATVATPADTMSATGATASGWTYAYVPTYRRGLFGRSVFTGRQLRAVPAAQTTAGIGATAGGVEATGGLQGSAGISGAGTRPGADTGVRGAGFDADVRTPAAGARGGAQGRATIDQQGAGIQGGAGAQGTAGANPPAAGRTGASADTDLRVRGQTPSGTDAGARARVNTPDIPVAPAPPAPPSP